MRVQSMRIKKVSARVRANTSKTRQRADGSYPIELLIRFDRQTKHVVILKEHCAIINGQNSNWKITTDSEGLIKERFKKTYPNYVKLNRDIDDLELKASNLIDSLDTFSYDRFFKRLKNLSYENVSKESIRFDAFSSRSSISLLSLT